MKFLQSALSLIRKASLPKLNLPIVGIVLVTLIIAGANYTPGAYLVGWDTVMPELSHGFNFTRSLTSVWQEYRGLGVIDVMGHATNIVHSIQIMLLDLVLPEHLVRYTFTLLMLMTGGIGMYLLTHRLLKNKPVAFISALFYMLNIGTIQMFFAPLEVFTVHFAALPWLTIAIMHALQHGTKRAYLILFAASLLFVQQAFVPTIFLVYLMLVAAFLTTFLLYTRNLRRVIIVGLVILAANAFWLLPFLYASLTHSGVIESTRINQFSSNEIFYRNKAHGTLWDTLRGVGFMTEAIEYNVFTKENFHFMSAYRNMLMNPIYIAGSITIITLMLVGVFTIIKRRLRAFYPFLALSLLSFFFLANAVPGLEQANNFVRDTIPFFGEAFRFPFTKFILLFMFCYSVLLGVGTETVAKLIGHALYARITRARTTAAVTFITAALVISMAFPAFTGNFFSPHLRLQIPGEYFQTFEYFKNQDTDKRVLLLPMHTFWNWQYTDWGFRGSGFLWHGIEQPILMRSFDPWSIQNEQLYNEFSYAMNTQDGELVKSLLGKYDVSYVVVDDQIINTLSSAPLRNDKLMSFLTSVGLKPDETFGNISVFKNPAAASFVSTIKPENTVRTANAYTSNFIDPLLMDTTHYVHDPKNADMTSVFPSLSTLKLPDDAEFTIEEDETSFTISPKNVAVDLPNATLALPSLYRHEFLIPVTATSNESEVIIHPLYPEVIINGETVTTPMDEIRVPSPVAFPTEMTLADTEHAIRLDGSEIGYILNNIPNTLRVRNDTEEAYLTFDLTDRTENNLFIKLTEPITSFSVRIPKGSGTLANYNVIPTNRYELTDPAGTLTNGEDADVSITTGSAVTITAKNTAKTLAFYDKDLFHRGSYIVMADLTNVSGLSPSFFADNPNAARAEAETRFREGANTAIVPPTDTFDRGYGFHITVKSEGHETATATINRLEVFPLPLMTMVNMRVFNRDAAVFTNDAPEKVNAPYTKTGTFYYAVENAEGIVVLSQAYSEAWHAYRVDGLVSRALPFVFGERLDSHVTVDNWANGWEIKDAHRGAIVIVFLPQYLAYLGIGLGVLTLSTLLAGKYAVRIITPLRRINGYFEHRASVLQGKIHASRVKTAFPYDINLSTNS